MIDAFGEQYNYEVIRYTDQKSKNVIDVYGAGDTFGNEFGDRD
jgi:bifunctional ADP-heptose synthase (sugar kinase/adenylyltransferase)